MTPQSIPQEGRKPLLIFLLILPVLQAIYRKIYAPTLFPIPQSNTKRTTSNPHNNTEDPNQNDSENAHCL